MVDKSLCQFERSIGVKHVTVQAPMLNQHIPSWVLQDLAPLQAYPQAAHSGRSYRPEWEDEMLDLERVFGYLANCRWFRRVRANGRLNLERASR